MTKCPKCGYIEKNRSNKISTHFHSHVSQIAIDTAISRNEIYMRVLLLACETEADGGSEYPYTIVDDILYPHRTSSCTNKQMITAVAACHLYATTVCDPPVILREKEWAEQND